MNEKQWAENVKEFLSSIMLSNNIKIDTLTKLPYASEIMEYNINFEPQRPSNMLFETDILIYEQDADVIKPRIIIETKLKRVTTHDAIVYSYKAQNHKTITPFIRYGIIIGNRRHYPLPGRLFRHGMNFDFMISFQKEEIDKDEKKYLKNYILWNWTRRKELEIKYGNRYYSFWESKHRFLK